MGALTFFNMRNLVVLPLTSSIFSATISRLSLVSAANLLAIAAAVSASASGRSATICAALEVDEVSCLSIPLKCFERYFSHWPHACGCVYSFWTEEYRSSSDLPAIVTRMSACRKLIKGKMTNY